MKKSKANSGEGKPETAVPKANRGHRAELLSIPKGYNIYRTLIEKQIKNSVGVTQLEQTGTSQTNLRRCKRKDGTLGRVTGIL